MICIRSLADINWTNLEAVVYEQEPLELDAELLSAVAEGRQRFERLIEQGTP